MWLCRLRHATRLAACSLSCHANAMLVAALLLVAVLAFVGVAWAIPYLMPLFARYALARPTVRSSHRVPIPQGGGVAVVAAVILLTFAVGWSGVAAGGALQVERYYTLALAGCFAMALLGAADDMRPLPAWTRFVIQTALAGIVIFAAPDAWRLFPQALPLDVERALSVVGLVWMVNLTNFMDGIDGIVVAEAVPLALALAGMAGLGLLSVKGGFAAAALAGGLGGFFLYNRHPARLFLGDVGSLPVGLLLGALLFELAATQNIAAALLLPLYFLADATGTLLRGLLARADVFKPHRRHAYQNAVDGGLPVETVIGRILLLNLGLVLLAYAALLAGSTAAHSGLLLMGIVACALVIRRLRAAR